MKILLCLILLIAGCDEVEVKTRRHKQMQVYAATIQYDMPFPTVVKGNMWAATDMCDYNFEVFE